MAGETPALPEPVKYPVLHLVGRVPCPSVPIRRRKSPISTRGNIPVSVKHYPSSGNARDLPTNSTGIGIGIDDFRFNLDRIGGLIFARPFTAGTQWVIDSLFRPKLRPE